MHRWLLAPVLTVSLALPQVAVAAPREGPPPPPSASEDEPEPVGTLSQQGSRRGAIELGLGTLLSGAAVGLAAFGTVQFTRARAHVDFCREEDPTYIYEFEEPPDAQPMGIDPCVFDPPALGFASAGLSWGFSALLLTGAGLLFARGARVLGDARRWDRLHISASPWWRRHGGGASFTLRF